MRYFDQIFGFLVSNDSSQKPDYEIYGLKILTSLLAQK